MKMTLILMGILAGILLAVSPARAQADEAAVPSQAVEAGNKICPVSGEEIGSMGEGIKVEYNGVIYNLCCPGCESPFLKDPEKYIKIVEEEMRNYEDSVESIDY
ncbi:MAG: hypothetical protein AB7S78_13225 [Candidatus Omnitrophota bacterium]